MTRGGNDGCEAARRSWLETARSGGRCAHCGSRTLAPSLGSSARPRLRLRRALHSAACFFFCEEKGHGPSIYKYSCEKSGRHVLVRFFVQVSWWSHS